MQGICVEPEAVQVKGNCKRYKCWGDRIYIKIEWLGTFFGRILNNRREREVNGR
jgi:hypothetical protein